MALLHTDPGLKADFDQHQRYLAAALLLRPLLEPLGRPARLLEVGSNVLHLLPAFLAPLPIEVVRADVVDVPAPGSRFVKLDADGRLPFPDEVFDLVVALEVLEHIAQEDRLFAVSEWSRVSRQGVLFSCPRRSRAVREAERRVDRHFRSRHGRSHPWLAEHAQFGIPSKGEIRAICGKLGLRAHAFGNAPLSEWLALQLLSEELADVPAVELREFCQQVVNSKSMRPLTRQRPYRRLYMAFKSDEAARRAVSLWRGHGIGLAAQDADADFDPVAHLAQRLRRLLTEQSLPAAFVARIQREERERHFATRRAEQATEALAEARLELEALTAAGNRKGQQHARFGTDVSGIEVAPCRLRPMTEHGPECWEALGAQPYWQVEQRLPKGWVLLQVQGQGPAGQAVTVAFDHGSGFADALPLEVGRWAGPQTFVRPIYLHREAFRWRLQPQESAGPLRLCQASLQSISTKSVLAQGWRHLLGGLVCGKGWGDLVRAWMQGGVRALIRLPLERWLAAQDVPADVPLPYEQWASRQEPTPEQIAIWLEELRRVSSPPTLAVWLPLPTLETVADLRRSLESLADQATYDRWSLGISVQPKWRGRGPAGGERPSGPAEGARPGVVPPGGGPAPPPLNALLDELSADFGVLLRCGHQMGTAGLLQLAQAITKQPTGVCFYTDEDQGHPYPVRHAPRLKPDWAPDAFLTGSSLGGLLAVRRSTCRQVGGFEPRSEGAHETDLVARLAARHPDGIVHVPRVLLHRQGWAWEPDESPEAVARVLARHLDEGTLGVAGTVSVEGQRLRVRPRIGSAPLVSIVIPTAGRPVRLDGNVTTHIDHLLRSLRSRTGYRNYEIIVVDNGQLPETTIAQLARHDVRRVTLLTEFSFAGNLNEAAARARGEHLLFLNDDMEVLHADWLEELVGWSCQREIGAVGGKLFFADGRLQHAGIALYAPGPGHPLYGEPDAPVADPTFGQVRNALAVTGACLMTPRRMFEQLGGFDRAFALNYNDVDYCLRVWRAGKRVVWTPHAELVHFERVRRDGRAAFRPEELERFRARWQAVYPRDPFLNPNFSPNHHDFRLRLPDAPRPT